MSTNQDDGIPSYHALLMAVLKEETSIYIKILCKTTKKTRKKQNFYSYSIYFIFFLLTLCAKTNIRLYNNLEKKMEPRVTIDDKTFELTIPEKTILEAVDKCAQEINTDYSGKNPLFVIVLGGAFIFGADLVRRINTPCQISFVKIASYEGLSTTNVIKEQLPVNESIKGRHVIIVEDIVETGQSMEFLKKRLESFEPASVEICALSFKPEKCKVPDLKIKYVGMQLPEAFIVGYGLDYNLSGRNLKDIYSLVE